jgi:hypothetical protein
MAEAAAYAAAIAQAIKARVVAAASIWIPR